MKDFELSLNLCQQMAQAAEKAQNEQGIDVCIAIADRHGHLRYFYRFGEAFVISIEIAQNKAYTSAVIGQSTADFGQIAQVGGPAFGINVSCPRLVIFGGGFPLQIDGKTVGGIGVSGGSVEQDEAIAQKMLEAFRSLTA